MDKRQQNAADALSRLAPPEQPSPRPTGSAAEQIRAAMQDGYLSQATHSPATHPRARNSSVSAGMAGWLALAGIPIMGLGCLLAVAARADGPRTLGLVCAVIGGALLVIGLAALPGSIARSRHHHNADAIALLGFFGVFVPLLWIVAVVWAYTAVRERS